MGKKEIRANFRNSVFKRDGNKCMLCGRSDVKLDAHHITNREEMLNGGCHYKVEAFYNSEEMIEDPENELHPYNLYKLIGSSHTKADRDSAKL